MTSAWVALVYDLISKYRELEALDDPSVKPFLCSWDKATASNDIKKLLELEASIIDDATNNTQAVNHIAGKHLHRLREDRHLCAHPAFSTEAALFEPSSELVRVHLVNAVDLVLSQEPLQGKAIFQLYDADVQSPGFPAAPPRIIDYVQQRYLERIRAQNIYNFGTVLAKSLLKGIPVQWEPVRRKITFSLLAIRERAPETWAEVFSAIIKLIDNLEPPHRARAIAFLAVFPDFWNSLSEATKTSLQETVENANPATQGDYRILAGVTIPQFRPALLRSIKNLNALHLAKAIATQPLDELWPRAVIEYEKSGSFRGSEDAFRDLIVPFSGYLNSEKFDQLLKAITSNQQNWDASETDHLLLSMLLSATATDRPTTDTRDYFYQFIHRARRIEKYKAVFSLFEDHGWVTPPIQPLKDE